MGRKLRRMKPPVALVPLATLHARTRLKGLTQCDIRVLEAVGHHLSTLASRDLAERCAIGEEHDVTDWKERKRALTPECSSRWAGAITKTNNATYQAARRNMLRALSDTRRAVAAIERRIQQPTREMLGCKESGGYADRRERQAKFQRLEKLRSRLSRLETERDEGHVSICRGGKRLLKNRLHLEKAEFTEEQWRSRWEAKRTFLYAEGESGKKHGNETIRLYPDGALEIKLPAPLSHLANVAHGRYRLEGTATFSYHAEGWLSQAGSDRAVAYRIWLDPEKGRWYVDASFTPPERHGPEILPYEEAVRDGAIGVDLNGGHLACWRLDASGNPVGAPKEIRLELEGLPSTTRDGRLRAAVSELLRYARECGTRAVAIEDLGFDEALVVGRETMGRGKCGRRWRRSVAGIPTSKFRSRLLAMATRMGVAVVAVDPAYTSKWGRRYWREPTSSRGTRRTSVHESAAIVVARRCLGHGARRNRVEKLASDRRIEKAEVSSSSREAPAEAENHHPSLVRPRGNAGGRSSPQGGPASREGVRPEPASGEGASFRSSKTVRDGPLTESTSLSWRG